MVRVMENIVFVPIETSIEFGEFPDASLLSRRPNEGRPAGPALFSRI